MVSESERNLESVYHTLTTNRTELTQALAKSQAMEIALNETLEKISGEKLSTLEIESQIALQREMTIRLRNHLLEIEQELGKYTSLAPPDSSAEVGSN